MNRALKAMALAGVALFIITAAQAQETFKIGGLVSLTGGGASIGKVSDIAWKLAIEDINAAGGILGKKAMLVMADTATDPTHGVSEARRLIENEGIRFMVGPATSQEVIPVVAIGKEKGVVQITTAASTDLTPEVGPYHFSTSVTGLNQLKPAVDYALATLKAKKIAIMSDNGGMSKAAVKEISEYMTSKGVTPVITQEYAFRAQDMTPQIMSMRNAGADAVLFLSSLGDDARKFLENRADLGWNAPVLANLTMSNFAVANAKAIGKDAFKDVYSVQFSGMTYCPGDKVGEAPFAKFVARARAAVPDIDRIGGAPSLTPFYIEPMILAAAVNGAKSTDAKEVAAWLEANSGKVPSIIGPLGASKTTHFLPALEAIKVVKNAYDLREDGLLLRADCK